MNIRIWILAAICSLAAMLATTVEAQEAIGISGYWKITVSDPNGTNPQVYEFSNALADQGGELLEFLLSVLVIDPAPTEGACAGILCPRHQVCYSGSCYSTCALPFSPLETESVSAALTIAAQGDLGNPLSFPASVDGSGVFRTRWISDRNIDISQVSTALLGISANCADPSADPRLLTQKTLESPIPVEAGQLLNIEVDISFSTATP